MTFDPLDLWASQFQQVVFTSIPGFPDDRAPSDAEPTISAPEAATTEKGGSSGLSTEAARAFASGRLIRLVAASNMIGPSQTTPGYLAGRTLTAIWRRFAAT